ncbi:MAG: hypothetical protein ACJ72A_01695 [Nocardioidaceae bacterium]
MKSLMPPPVSWVPDGHAPEATMVSILRLPSLSTAWPGKSKEPVRPAVRANEPACTPSTMSAFRLGILTVLPTFSVGVPALELTASAVPALFVSVVVVVAALDRPRMKFPPVAAKAVPPPSTSAVTAPAAKKLSLDERT